MSSLERYNPNNLVKLEEYITAQMRENFNDLEANLAVLKLYQFDPSLFKVNVCSEILIKALSNMPHTDFVLAKCLIDSTNVSHFNWFKHVFNGVLSYTQLELEPIKSLCGVHHLLETCQFAEFWVRFCCNIS